MGKWVPLLPLDKVRGPFLNLVFLPADSGDYLKRVLHLSDSESLVPSDEQVCIYENKVTPSTSCWPGATWRE